MQTGESIGRNETDSGTSWAMRRFHFRYHLSNLSQILILLMVSSWLSLYLNAAHYYTMYPSLDWFNPPSIWGYKWLNLTEYHIFECCLMLGCFMVNRHYPKEFNIKSEILMGAILNWLFNNQMEIFSASIGRKEGDEIDCIFGLWNFNGLADSFRCLSFVIVLYYLTRQSNFYFPLPFTWIFKDLSKFIFEPTCIKVFREYLIKKEPKELVHLDRIMKIYLNASKANEQTPGNDRLSRPSTEMGTYLLSHSEGTAKQQLIESMNSLRPSFRKFKKTISFKALFMKVKEFEEISQKIYS